MATRRTRKETINIVETPRFVCFKCFKPLVESNFYKSNSVAYSRLPVCKGCLVSLFEEFKKQLMGDKPAIYRLCQLYDVYYDVDLVNKCINSVKSKKITAIEAYMSSLNKSSSLKEKNFSDSRIDEAPKGDYTSDKHIIWGGSLTKEDYDFLDYRYEEWCRSHKHTLESEKETIRSLCILELNKRKALEAKDMELYVKIVKEHSNLVKMASFDPAKAKELEGGDSEKCWGAIIAKIEKERPAEYVEDKKLYQDVDSLKKYYKDFILRPLINTVRGTKDFNISDEDKVFDKK